MGKYAVPTDLDYVSIDIDGCDLWVFLALTLHFRPRVVSIEYNMHYDITQSRVCSCELSSGEHYVHTGFDEYGASLAAISKAALLRGYVVVQVIPPVDVVLVRSDLVCPGTSVDME